MIPTIRLIRIKDEFGLGIRNFNGLVVGDRPVTSNVDLKDKCKLPDEAHFDASSIILIRLANKLAQAIGSELEIVEPYLTQGQLQELDNNHYIGSGDFISDMLAHCDLNDWEEVPNCSQDLLLIDLIADENSQVFFYENALYLDNQPLIASTDFKLKNENRNKHAELVEFLAEELKETLGVNLQGRQVSLTQQELIRYDESFYQYNKTSELALSLLGEEEGEYYEDENEGIYEDEAKENEVNNESEAVAPLPVKSLPPIPSIPNFKERFSAFSHFFGKSVIGSSIAYALFYLLNFDLLFAPILIHGIFDFGILIVSLGVVSILDDD